MEIRDTSRSSIQYIIIQKRFHQSNPLLFPAENTNSIYHYLQRFPRDFTQLHNQKLFFDISIYPSYLNPALNLLVFDDFNLKHSLDPIIAYNDVLKLKDRVVVYFIDINSAYPDILQSIEKTKQKHWYYCFYGETKQSLKVTVEFNRYFNSLENLLELFKRDFESIKKMFSDKSDGYKDMNFILDEQADSSELLDFNPLIPNFFTLSQINNLHWKVNYPQNRENIHELRNSSLLEIIKKIDEIHLLASNEKLGTSSFPILIAIFPFLNPTTKKFLKQKQKNNRQKFYSEIYGLEQSMDYINSFEAKSENLDLEEKTGKIVQEELVKPKLLLLDAIAYLQSSFTFSPVFRSPLVGQSIYRELSMFNPLNRNFLTQKSLNKISKPLTAFGEKLSSLTIHRGMKEYLKSRSGQILAISDLPIEWLTLDSVPLCFSHDLCRIPEINYQGIINNYSANNRLTTQIESNILERTLIILSGEAEGDSDHEFTESYNLIKKNAQILNYHYRYCNTVKEVAKAIREVNPYLLVFDCHGNIEANNETSYLSIGKEKLGGREISKYKIAAPIVFLSCCNTSPNYGYTNQIHDAFFEVGAITITGTFLPISIKRGTSYYIRLLLLLKEQVHKTLFQNWLSFVSYAIRISIIQDAVDKASKTLKRKLSEIEIIALKELLLEVMTFEKRRELFLKLLDEGIEISPDLKINIADTDCEFLMYTHYGRPDLISFSSEI